LPIAESRTIRAWAAAGLAGLGAFVLLHAWTPAGDAASSICLLRRLFHLAKGDWSAAVALHPLAPVLAAELILGWAAWGIALAARRPLRLPAPVDTLLLANLAALVALWLGRVATGTLPW